MGATKKVDVYLHRSGCVTHGVADPAPGQHITFLLVVQPDGRAIASDVRDSAGKPVDEAVLREQQAAEKHAALDRVKLHYGSDTFVGRKDHNEDRYMVSSSTLWARAAHASVPQRNGQLRAHDVAGGVRDIE